MSKSWQAYAAHIIDTVSRLEQIRQRGDLTQDVVLYDATLRNLQTLSESTQHLPEDIKNRFPLIPWKQISGFRNILVHNYLGDIDAETIVGILDNHLPPLADAINQILKDQANAP